MRTIRMQPDTLYSVHAIFLVAIYTVVGELNGQKEALCQHSCEVYSWLVIPSLMLCYTQVV